MPTRVGAGGAGGREDYPVVQVKRIYDDAAPADGRRVLVDRLWPRGLRKDAAAFDEWLREIAPSDGLRRWYRHEPARFDEFAERYRAELAEPERTEALDRLREYAAAGPLTLLTAARDLEYAHPRVLADVLAESVGGSS
jgi:uncharacterized protein YeaO (DUF488 family)